MHGFYNIDRFIKHFNVLIFTYCFGIFIKIQRGHLHPRDFFDGEEMFFPLELHAQQRPYTNKVQIQAALAKVFQCSDRSHCWLSSKMISVRSKSTGCLDCTCPVRARSEVDQGQNRIILLKQDPAQNQTTVFAQNKASKLLHEVSFSTLTHACIKQGIAHLLSLCILSRLPRFAI